MTVARRFIAGSFLLNRSSSRRDGRIPSVMRQSRGAAFAKFSRKDMPLTRPSHRQYTSRPGTFTCPPRGRRNFDRFIPLILANKAEHLAGVTIGYLNRPGSPDRPNNDVQGQLFLAAKAISVIILLLFGCLLLPGGRNTRNTE